MRELKGSTQDEMRRHNLANFLRYLHVHGASSRTDITAQMQLNRSTVGDLAGELIAAGLARSAGEQSRPGAGRPSLVVEPATELVYVVAIEIAVDRVVVARVGGVLLDRREQSIGPDEHAAAKVLRTLLRMVRASMKDAPADAACVGIGVGVCGVVAQADGRVRFAPNLGWVDVPLGAMLRKRLRTNLPIALGNDANLGVLAEQVRGSAQGADCVVYLNSGVGVGAGIVVDGKPLLGTGGFAGEIGHMVINTEGRQCRCGSRGCWETEIGGEAIRSATGVAPDVPISSILVAATNGDEATLMGLKEVGHWLGLGVLNVVNIFNPKVVIFGGSLSQLYPCLSDIVEAEVEAALAAPREQVVLTVPAFGVDSTLMGAAEIAFAPLLADPIAFAAALGGQG
jgi:predicted NBD/HSP70 family sugar kinase